MEFRKFPIPIFNTTTSDDDSIKKINKKNPHPNYVSSRRYSNWFYFIILSIIFQFRKLSNVYFLITGLVMLIPNVSPLTPWSAIGPLIFVLLVSEIREFIEEILRVNRDELINSKSYTRRLKNIQSGSIKDAEDIENIQWQDLSVGDVFLLNSDEYKRIPADCIVIDSSHANKNVYVHTANLDGETSLKTKQCVSYAIENFSNCDVSVEEPHADMYRFHGKLKVDEVEIPLSTSNVLLRGSVLCNTEYALCVAVYVGHDTKTVINAKSFVPAKITKMEMLMNNAVVILFVIQIFLCIIAIVFERTTYKDIYDDYWYLNGLSNDSAIKNFLTFFILLNTLIPISLWVTLEILKFIQSFFIEFDYHLHKDFKNENKLWRNVSSHKHIYPPLQTKGGDTGTHCLVNSKNLHEELGMVRYIFSDKTGTLTCNKMKFIGGYVPSNNGIGWRFENTTFKNLEGSKKKDLKEVIHYGLSKDSITVKSPLLSPMHLDFGDGVFRADDDLILSCQQDFLSSLTNNNNNNNNNNLDCIFKEPFLLYFFALSTCHTIEDTTRENVFASTSPDEAALVSFSGSVGGISFKKWTSSKSFKLNVLNLGEVSVRLVHLIPFKSENRMMSVIVEVEDNNLQVLITKGADDVVLKLLESNSVDNLNVLKAQVLNFSNKGYRTLCIGAKIIEDRVFEEDINKYILSGKIDEFNTQLVSQLNIAVGVTAVEDALQEGVFDTITLLRQANMKVAMITGDQKETALNIATSCGLITDRNATTIYTMVSSVNMFGGGNFIPLDIVGDDLVEIKDDTSSSIHSPQVFPPSPRSNSSSVVFRNTTDYQRASSVNSGLRKTSLIQPEHSAIYNLNLEVNKYVTSHTRKSLDNVLKPTISSLFAVVVEGSTFSHIVSHKNALERLLNVICHENCECVVFCRVTPKQKGQIVSAMKSHISLKKIYSDLSKWKEAISFQKFRKGKNKTKNNTILFGSVLAVGDGMNDVNMILNADVGVGLFGQEGYQAASSADYAICKFQDLNRLIFFHGRLHYIRNAHFIKFFIYKNFVFTLCQFWYGIYSNFSGQTVFEDWYVLLFNSVFAVVPMVVIAVIDFDLRIDEDVEYSSNNVLSNRLYSKVIYPLLYTNDNKHFSGPAFLYWIILGILHSVCLFFGTLQAMLSFTNDNGLPNDLWMFSICLYTSVIFLISNLILIYSYAWSKFYLICVFVLNIILYIAFVYAYNAIFTTSLVYGVINSLQVSSSLYLNVVLWVTLSVAPIVIFRRVYKLFIRPSLLTSIKYMLYDKFVPLFSVV